MKEPDLPTPITHPNLAGQIFTLPLKDLLIHLTYHSQYHRGQNATRMRALGSNMEDTGLVAWQRLDRPKAEWV